MTFTANDIRAEHEAAVAAFTEAQRRALGRLEHARRRSPFNNRSPLQNLTEIFAIEAERRNAAVEMAR